MKVFFHFPPTARVLAASFPLARALADRGHDVVYSTGPEGCAAVALRGFRAIPVHRDIWRSDKARSRAEVQDRERRDLAALVVAQRIADEYFRGRIEADLDEVRPAVVVADALGASPIQLAAYAAGIPCVQLSATFSQRIGSRPPLTSTLDVDASPIEQESAAWLASCLNDENAPLGAPALVSSFADRYATRFGYPTDALSFDTVFTPTFTRCTEIVAAPGALDFPHPDAAEVYAALPVEIRDDEPVPESLRRFNEEGTPLVVAWLGGASPFASSTLHLVDAVVAAARLRPHRRTVIAGAFDLAGTRRGEVPPNVLWLTGVPRHALLRRAAVLVTCGDLLDLREAVELEVPLVVVPHERDQHGNAARVAHHGVGIAVPAWTATGETVAAAVDAALAEGSSFAGRLRTLASRTRHEEQRPRAVDLIERLAASCVAPPPPPARDLSPAAPGGRDGWLFLDAEGALATKLAGGGPCVVEGAHDPDGVAPRFTICATLGDALGRAEGPMLARVTLIGAVVQDGPYATGASLACTAILDVRDILQDYAAWCAEEALAVAADHSPERVAMCRRLLADVRARKGADEATRAALMAGALRWHRGFGAAALAVASDAAANAQMARFEALACLAHAASENDSERFRAEYLRLVARFDDELRVRIMQAYDAATRDG